MSTGLSTTLSDTLYNESSYSNNCLILQVFLVIKIYITSALSVGLVGSQKIYGGDCHNLRQVVMNCPVESG